MHMMVSLENVLYTKELSELALNAAITVEDVIAGKDVKDFSAIENFAGRISASIDGSVGDKKLKDVTLVPVFCSALSSTTGTVFNDTKTLIDTLYDVVKSSDLKTDDDQFAPAKFRDFCLAVYGALVSTTLAERDKTFSFPSR
jgi:hypothetical protein